MYKIHITYKLSGYGESWAEIVCEEADENFTETVLPGREGWRYITGRYQSWEELEPHVTAVLEAARDEIARRRTLLATHPPERIVEL